MRFIAKETELAQCLVAGVVKRVSFMRRHDDDVAGPIGLDARARVALAASFEDDDYLLDGVHMPRDFHARAYDVLMDDGTLRSQVPVGNVIADPPVGAARRATKHLSQEPHRYSPLILAALMTGHHLAISAFW